MKKITVTNYEKGTDVGLPNPRFSTMELEGPEEMDAGDGYHTFTELYDHRITLFIALCRTLLREAKGGEPYANGGIWRSAFHNDGSSFNGWFIMGIRTDPSHQISYHLPIVRWKETEFAFTLKKAPEWDGHTSADVLERLKVL